MVFYSLGVCEGSTFLVFWEGKNLKIVFHVFRLKDSKNRELLRREKKKCEFLSLCLPIIAIFFKWVWLYNTEKLAITIQKVSTGKKSPDSSMDLLRFLQKAVVWLNHNPPDHTPTTYSGDYLYNSSTAHMNRKPMKNTVWKLKFLGIFILHKKSL